MCLGNDGKMKHKLVDAGPSVKLLLYPVRHPKSSPKERKIMSSSTAIRGTYRIFYDGTKECLVGASVYPGNYEKRKYRLADAVQ